MSNFMRKLFSTSAGSRPAGAACTGMAAAPLQAGPGCAAHYRHLLERMPVFVAELAAGGEILHLNAAAESMLGWSAAEMRGKSWLSLLLPHGDQTQLPRLHELFAAGREVSGCKSGLRTRDGAPRWLEWNTCNMPGLEGDDVGRICFGTDVTAQVRSEDRLRLQVAALEAAANAIMITDANGTIEWVNHAFSVLTGYSNDEAVGRNPRELVKSAEQGAQTYAELWGTIGAGQVWRGELVNRRKDNTTYHEDMTITPVADGKGVVRHFVAVKQDVTQRKATERELEAHRNYLEALVRRRTMELEISESRARHILESSAAGLFGMDREGRINFVNPAACRMLGYASADLVGKHAHDTFHHSRPDGTPYPHDECPQTAILSAGGSARSDTEVYWRADGSPIFIDYVAQPLIERGEIAGAVVSFIDISERRQALAAREAALREAERLARTRSEFLSNMSHEIRTPLNAILGFARAGCGGDTGRRSRERFEWILDSGELLLGIINDILDLARIDAGKLVMERLPCGLDEVVERVMRQYLELARAKGLHLSVERAPGLPVAFIGDALRLSQILMNLISNAIKFTEKGSVRLEISSQAGVLVFRVVDTGIGMRPDELERIFAAFEQADMSTTRRFGGSGLGLSICKRLAELMGAEIGVESTPGRGSRFELRLPLVEADAPAQCGAAQELTVSTAPRLAGVSILAAEDNELNRLVLEEVLRAEGPRLVCVENGRQLVERVREDGPEAWDIVLMDIQMPEMDGLEATRRVHELAPELQVIALTAHAFSEEGDNCRAAGMADHVSKPFELDALVSAILRHKRRRPPGDAHAPHLHLVRP